MDRDPGGLVKGCRGAGCRRGRTPGEGPAGGRAKDAVWACLAAACRSRRQVAAGVMARVVDLDASGARPRNSLVDGMVKGIASNFVVMRMSDSGV